MKSCWIALVVPLALLAGCSGANVRSQSPEELLNEGRPMRLVGDLAAPAGMHTVKVESVALVSNLPGTGSDPPPSFERAAILSEMQVRGVNKPNQVLASGNASVVLSVGYLRPGIQKGDHFDLELRIPSRSETTSLRGGWLMETRLKELASVNQQLREGTLWAVAHGPVLVNPSAADGVEAGRGRVLGGGVALRDRSLGLVLKSEHRSVPKSSLVGKAVNTRFHVFVAGSKQGVAKPLNDEYIELAIHPRYKHNVARYMQVVRAVPLRETPAERLERLAELERQLLDPVTSDTAALRLEAIGKEGIPALQAGLSAEDPLVRFHAAEALAYLDEPSAATALTEAAREEPAFRLFALTALSVLSDYRAYDGLQSLLTSPSAETRYGAFRALWAMNPDDALVKGELINEEFHFHHLKQAEPPLVHLTHSVRPELVIFGQPAPLALPLLLEAGQEVLIRSNEAGELTITRFQVEGETKQTVVPNEWDALVRGLGEVGATYPDLVQILQQAKEKQLLTCRLEVDAVPEGGRFYRYRRGDEAEGQLAGEESAGTGVAVTSPLPDLFPKRAGRRAGEARAEAPAEPDEDEASSPEKKGRPVRRALGKLRG